MKRPYTDKQGQYLAFIYYGKIHGSPPSESEMQQYFQVSPPSVHQMILTLETHGLIERTPGQARSIRLLIPRDELPDYRAIRGFVVFSFRFPLFKVEAQ
jgi:repressor LexA